MIVVDSPAALEHARSRAARDPLLATDNPLLAAKFGLLDLDGLVVQESVSRTGVAAVTLAEQTNEYIGPLVDPDRAAGETAISTTRPVRVLVAGLLHRASVLARSMDKEDPNIIEFLIHEAFGDCTNHNLDPGRYAHPFPALAKAGFLRGCEYRTEIVEAPSEGAFNDTASRSLLARLAVLPATVVLQLLYSRIQKRVRSSGRRRVAVPIVGDSEALREAAAALRRRGVELIPFSSVAGACAPKNVETIVPDRSDHERKLADVLYRSIQEQLGDIFHEAQSQAIASVLAGRIMNGIPYMNAALIEGAKYADLVHEQAGRPKVVLTSAMSHLACAGFHRRAGQLGMRVVLCEHGIAKGLACLSSATSSGSEIHNCDLFLAVSPCSAQAVEAEGTPARVIGLPSQVKKVNFPVVQRHLARSRLQVPRAKSTLFHVSPLPYYANQRPGHLVASEAWIFGHERKFIEDIYPHVDKHVLFKSYPTRRFPYHPSAASIAAAPANLTDVGMEDFRYLRAAADIIVTGTATSTLGWCLGTQAPVVWWHSRKVSPVHEHLMEQIESALFVIDVDKHDFADEFVELLQRPLANLQSAWQAKRTAREAFLEHAIFGSHRRAGENAAAAVLSTDQPTRQFQTLADISKHAGTTA